VFESFRNNNIFVKSVNKHVLMVMVEDVAMFPERGIKINL